MTLSVPHRYQRPLLAIIAWFFTLSVAAFALSISHTSFEPTKRPFNPNDASISFPYQTDSTVPTWALFLLSTFCPAVLIALRIALYPSLPITTRNWTSIPIRTRLVWLHQSWLGLATSLSTSLLLVDGLKNLLGKPRPDFLSRCGLRPGWQDDESVFIGPTRNLVTTEACTAPYGLHELKDGFRAFPSGHAAYSFAGLLYLSFWLRRWFIPPTASTRRSRFAVSSSTTSSTPSSTFERLDPPHLDNLEAATREIPRAIPASQKGFWGWVLILIPLSLASWCAATRYADFRHAGFDILAGVVIGVGAAFLGWSAVGKRAGRGGWRAVVTDGVVGIARVDPGPVRLRKDAGRDTDADADVDLDVEDVDGVGVGGSSERV